MTTLTMPVHDEPGAESTDRGVCHYCDLRILPGEKAIKAKNCDVWAHVTCWYDGGPFERDMLAKALIR
jgi:hypothetical protein